MNTNPNQQHIVKVSAAIIYENNKFLIARRKSNQKLAGFWEFPGGKIEKNENPHECLKRELLEEFNVPTETYQIIGETLYSYDSDNIHLIGIHTQILKHPLQLTVHDKIKWVTKTQIFNYKLAPADIPLVQKAIKYFE